MPIIPRRNYPKLLYNLLIRNIIVLIGFLVATGVYLILVGGGNDIYLTLSKTLQYFNSKDIDELIFIWIIPVIISWIINQYVKLGKKITSHRQKTYDSMVYASNHILRNFINQSQILKIEAEDNATFNKETIKKFEQCRIEAVDHIQKLSTLKNIDPDFIIESVQPKSFKEPVLSKIL